MAWPNAADVPAMTIDARLRLCGAALFALTCVGLTQFSALFAALAVSIVTAMAIRLPMRQTIKRMVALDGFMLLVLATLPFTTPGQPLFSLLGEQASLEGLRQAGSIVLKANAITLVILALPGAIDPVEVGHAMTRLRLPTKLTHLFLFTVRYIDVLNREYVRLRTAMRARGFKMGCNLHTWRSVGYLFGMLMVRSLERSERILAAMRCRGFTGRFPNPVENRILGRADLACACGMIAACAFLLLMDHAL